MILGNPSYKSGSQLGKGEDDGDLSNNAAMNHNCNWKAYV